MQAEGEETGWVQTVEIQMGKKMVYVRPFPTSINRPHHDFRSKNRTDILLHPVGQAVRITLGADMPDEMQLTSRL